MVVLHKLHADQAGGGVEVALVKALVEEAARVAIELGREHEHAGQGGGGDGVGHGGGHLGSR